MLPESEFGNAGGKYLVPYFRISPAPTNFRGRPGKCRWRGHFSPSRFRYCYGYPIGGNRKRFYPKHPIQLGYFYVASMRSALGML